MPKSYTNKMIITPVLVLLQPFLKGQVFFMAKKKFDYGSMFTLRKDGRYQGHYTGPDGIRHFVCDKDPEQLYLRLAEKQAEVDAGRKPKVPTFREVAGRWENKHREEIEIRTWKNYEPHFNAIVDEFGDIPFPDVEPGNIAADLARAKARGLSKTVVQSRRSIWRMIYDHAVVEGVVMYNPVTSIKLPKGLKQSKRKAPTTEQMDIICKRIDAPFGLFPFLLLCTGMRKSEALALQWSDIDLNDKEISVTKSIDYTVGSNPQYKAPKTDAGTREIPILDILLPVLREAKLKATSMYVFPCPPSNRGGPGGGLMTDRGYEGAWNRYCEAVGFIDEDGQLTLTAHQLRHGTATLMFELGVDELTAQKILGHSRIEITREIYTDLRSAQKSKSIGKFNRGMAKMMAKASGH